MIIREFSSSDLARIVELLEQLSPSGEKISLKKLSEVAGRIHSGSDHYVNVCDVDGLIVGTSHLYVQPNLSHGGRPRGHIENVVVDRNYRGRGIGRLLVSDLLRIAKVKGCYKVILNCKPENTLFYEGLEFRRTGEIEMRADLQIN